MASWSLPDTCLASMEILGHSPRPHRCRWVWHEFIFYSGLGAPSGSHSRGQLLMYGCSSWAVVTGPQVCVWWQFHFFALEAIARLMSTRLDDECLERGGAGGYVCTLESMKTHTNQCVWTRTAHTSKRSTEREKIFQATVWQTLPSTTGCGTGNLRLHML